MTFCREFLESMNFSTNREATGLERHPPVVSRHAKPTQRVASARNSLQFCCSSIAAYSYRKQYYRPHIRESFSEDIKNKTNKSICL